MRTQLKKGELFLRFLLDPHTDKKESKSLLLNLSENHLNTLSEILFNIFKNQELFSKHSKKIITKKRRFLNTFIKLAKRKNKRKQRHFLKQNLKNLNLILNNLKKTILKFFE